MSESFPVGFRHPKTQQIKACQLCGKEMPIHKNLPYGFFAICEECVKKQTKTKKETHKATTINMSRRVWINPFYSENFAKLIQMNWRQVWLCKCEECKQPIYTWQKTAQFFMFPFHLDCYIKTLGNIWMTKEELGLKP